MIRSKLGTFSQKWRKEALLWKLAKMEAEGGGPGGGGTPPPDTSDEKRRQDPQAESWGRGPQADE
jgi:hypothetical protein